MPHWNFVASIHSRKNTPHIRRGFTHLRSASRLLPISKQPVSTRSKARTSRWRRTNVWKCSSTLLSSRTLTRTLSRFASFYGQNCCWWRFEPRASPKVDTTISKLEDRDTSKVVACQCLLSQKVGDIPPNFHGSATLAYAFAPSCHALVI